MKPTKTVTVRISTDLVAQADELASRIANDPKFTSVFEITGKRPGSHDVIRHAVQQGLEFIERQIGPAKTASVGA